MGCPVSRFGVDVLLRIAAQHYDYMLLCVLKYVPHEGGAVTASVSYTEWRGAVGRLRESGDQEFAGLNDARKYAAEWAGARAAERGDRVYIVQPLLSC